MAETPLVVGDSDASAQLLAEWEERGPGEARGACICASSWDFFGIKGSEVKI